MERIKLKNKKILITGVSGFIGFHLAKRLLQEYSTLTIIGLDNMNDYYDVNLKEARLKDLTSFANFNFIKGNLADKNLIDKIFNDNLPSIIVI